MCSLVTDEAAVSALVDANLQRLSSSHLMVCRHEHSLSVRPDNGRHEAEGKPHEFNLFRRL
jgi:hypothetical protein